MEAVKKKKKKRTLTKVIITVAILAAIFAAGFGACQYMKQAAQEQLNAMNAMDTDVVSVRTLTKSVGATGKVISVRSKDITTTLTGVEIEQLHVQVGDTVSEGQVLVQFDTEDIAEELADAQHQLDVARKRNALTEQDAQRGVEDAMRSGDYQVQMAWNSMQNAYNAYAGAFDDLADLLEAEDTAAQSWEDAEDSLEEKNEQLQEKIDAEEYDGDYLTLQLEVYQLEQSIPQLKAAYNQAVKTRETMEDNIDSLYSAYETAALSYENMIATADSTVAGAQSGQQTAALSLDTDLQRDQVEMYEEQLEKGVIAAPFGGVVTAVNYDDGDTYLQGPIVTIQDCSAFEIEAQIGEYDISDIALGQQVIIKTDATREQELKGTVVFVAPTATAPAAAMAGMQTMSTDPTYEVRISVDSPADRLRLDMSANLSIIIDRHENAMTVPYSAVQTAEDGSAFVEVVGSDGESLRTVPVQVVMESNYYTQITGDLKEGDTVRLVNREASDMFSVMAQMTPGGF